MSAPYLLASYLRVLGFVAASAWLAVGCSGSKKIQVGATCLLNTDCNQPLVCTLSKCHEGCRATVDCPAGQICTKVENSGVCQLPDEAKCTASVPCGPLLICAADLRCRAGCSSSADCMGGQVCVQNVCAENNELDKGQLPQKAPTISDAGTYDTSSPDLPVTSPADVPVATSVPEAGATYDTSSPDVLADSPADVPVATSGPEVGAEAARESGPEVAPDVGSLDAGGTATDGTGDTTGTGGAGGAAATGGTTATGGSTATGGTMTAGGTTTTGGASAFGGATGGSTATVVCPTAAGPRMVKLPENYCIDSTEVTRDQYQAWLDTNPSTGNQDPTNCDWNTTFAPDPTCMTYPDVCPGATCGKQPQVCVNWCDAYAYCQGVGKRLCGRIGGGHLDYNHPSDATLDQWFNACVSGAAGNTYSYGSSYSKLACNDYDYGVGTTVEVGSIASCQSSVSGYAGTYDLSGNVEEWEDACNGFGRSGFCYSRGGSFVANDGAYCGSDAGYARSTILDFVGFRCCYP